MLAVRERPEAARRGRSPSWPLAIPPGLEQGNLFSAFNFSFSMGGDDYETPCTTGNGRVNTTVGRAQVATYRCPSESLPQHPDAGLGTMDYYGNLGGPASGDSAKRKPDPVGAMSPIIPR